MLKLKDRFPPPLLQWCLPLQKKCTPGPLSQNNIAPGVEIGEEEGEANLFLLDTMIAWREIENCIEMPQHFCRGMSTFFVVVLKRAVFNGSTKSSFKIFLNFTYEEEFIVSLKCPYRQNFYFFFNWFFISPNELLRKKNSIWIKCNLF